MTDKELKKLSRAELLEMLLIQTKEVEQLREELADAKEQLAQRQLRLEQCGSIAQAALEVSGIFETAQAAANQYLESVAQQEGGTQKRCQKLEAATRERCRRMEELTRKRCAEMLRQARTGSSRALVKSSEKIS